MKVILSKFYSRMCKLLSSIFCSNHTQKKLLVLNSCYHFMALQSMFDLMPHEIRMKFLKLSMIEILCKLLWAILFSKMTPVLPSAVWGSHTFHLKWNLARISAWMTTWKIFGEHCRGLIFLMMHPSPLYLHLTIFHTELFNTNHPFVH